MNPWALWLSGRGDRSGDSFHERQHWLNRAGRRSPSPFPPLCPLQIPAVKSRRQPKRVLNKAAEESLLNAFEMGQEAGKLTAGSKLEMGRGGGRSGCKRGWQEPQLTSFTGDLGWAQDLKSSTSHFQRTKQRLYSMSGCFPKSFWEQKQGHGRTVGL